MHVVGCVTVAVMTYIHVTGFGTHLTFADIAVLKAWSATTPQRDTRCCCQTIVSSTFTRTLGVP